MSRIFFAAGMVLAAPFSAAFWLCYLCGGLSDVLDGYAARKLNLQTAAGARLDSIADIAFGAALAVVMLKNVAMPMWLLVCAAAIALLRLAGYAVGWRKYRAFSALHTRANKITGLLIFAAPLLYVLLGISITGTIICAAALFSAAEELIVTIRSPHLDRDCTGLFW